MVNAAIVSRLVQTLSKQIVNICSADLEIRGNSLFNSVAVASPQGAVRFVVFEGFFGDEEVVAEGSDCELVELEMRVALFS